MKKVMGIFLILVLLLTGCGPQSETVETQPQTAASVETTTEETVSVETVMEETEPAETVAAETAPAETVQEETTSEDLAIIEEHLELYRPVLEKYAQALTEDWEKAQYADAGLSTQVRSYTGRDGIHGLAYSLEDLDGDGMMELLIGTPDGGYVADVYRLNGTQPERVIAAMKDLDENAKTAPEKDPEILWTSLYLCRDESGSFRFYYEVYKTWHICGYFSMVLEQGQLRVTESLLYNSVVDYDNPWYRTDGYILDYTKGVPISHDEASMIINGYVDYPGMITGMVQLEKLEHSWRFSEFK